MRAGRRPVARPDSCVAPIRAFPDARAGVRLHASDMKVLRTALGLAGLGGLYGALLRRPILNWGATAEEASARLPGDELLEDADGVATRAITIDAPAAAVWPWLAQMGPSPRGGAYTYDWIENLLGLDMHSADRVLPEFQHPAGRRHDRLRQEPHAARARRARARARVALGGRQLGLDVRARRARRHGRG